MWGVFHDFAGFELSPALVKRGPDHDAWVGVELVDDFFPFRAEILFEGGILGAVVVAIPCVGGPVVFVGAECRWHILPYEDSEAVAVVVPAGRFNFHVFADHVEPPFLGLFNIVAQGFVGWGGQQSVGPVSLVERAELE